MKKSIVFAALVLFVITLLYMLSRKEFARIPADEAHFNITEKTKCLECHAPGLESPLKKEHPPKDQCFECHKRNGR
jgi:hypothetical protein